MVAPNIITLSCRFLRGFESKFRKSFVVAAVFAVFIMALCPIANSELTANFIVRNSGTISLSQITANSGSAADIQAALNAATASGIHKVVIPAGVFDFVSTGSWVTVNIPNGVSLFGAPTQRDSKGQVVQWGTILRMPFEASSSSTFFRFSGTNGTRISDIQLVGYREIDPNSVKMYEGIIIENSHDFRIDHCYLRNICDNGINVINSNGVIDHNKLINNPAYVTAAIADCTVGYGVGVYGGGTNTPWETNIQDVFGKYTARTVFIEDNYFESWRHCVASNAHAHYVFRYNTERKNGYGSVDAHGKENAVPNPGDGTRAIEVYDNDFREPVWGIFAVQLRGGGGVFFNNTVDGYGIPEPGDWSSFVSMLQYTLDLYPDQQVRGVWIWNNTLTPAGADLWDAGWGGIGGNDNPIRENYEFFLRAPSQSQDGFTYTPYPYPHPLVTD